MPKEADFVKQPGPGGREYAAFRHGTHAGDPGTERAIPRGVRAQVAVAVPGRVGLEFVVASEPGRADGFVRGGVHGAGGRRTRYAASHRFVKRRTSS